ncbi:NAD-P-binding protein [Thelephora terrestris]|uniref:NAD-P-binding protein n=1 Tax=Thelephora terrestris TaxID=56493 RepID=A0A9P6HNZ3_9AGAM|nr:NAD-P-binding protein [Thelephora terrestris]
MDLGFKGTHVLVTGASGGIGLETARQFLVHGAKVTAHYNTNASSLDGLVGEFGTDRIQILQADLGDEGDNLLLFRKMAEGGFGPAQVIVVNHAIYVTEDVPVSQMSLEQWNRTVNANLTSTFLVIREYLRGLESLGEDRRSLKDKAAVVLIGSTAGKYGEAGHADYSATKSVMMYGLTMTLKNEIVKIAPKGRVNCVAPGWVKTPMAAGLLADPEIVYRALATTPLKKVATPLEIANQILVLASPTVSSHVTGQVVMVEGGMEGRLLNTREEVGL